MMNEKQPFWTSEKILGLSAMLISLCTLFVFIYQTNLIRKQQYMSVYPHLDISNRGTGTKNYQLILRNEGIGPALVKSVKITGPNGKIYDDIVDYLDEVFATNDSVNYLYSNITPGRLIPANEIIPIIEEANKNADAGLQIAKALGVKGLKAEILYESIYGEQWLLSSDELLPIKQ